MAPSSSPSASHSKPSERRRWKRALADLEVELDLAGNRCQARLKDISRAGVCFFLDRPIPLMTVLEVSLDLPVRNGRRHVGGHGAVVRCERIARGVEHYEVAVFLHEVAEADRRVIEEYVG